MINVIWWNSSDIPGSWACCHMLTEMLAGYGAEHHTPFDLIDSDTVIIVVHGGNAQLNGMGPWVAANISDYADQFEHVIFINIGDETSEFPNHLLKHPNSKLWLQTPLPSQQADRYLIEGYPRGTVRADVPRNLDWMFAGQITHDRRRDCVRELKALAYPNRMLIETESFGAGVPQADYLALMSRARVVPCPAGPATPDSFRMAEALELGCVPIIDAVSLKLETFGYWEKVFGEHPLPVVTDWEELPEVIAKVLENWERYQRLTQFFWTRYKIGFRLWLERNLIDLGAI